MQPSNADWKVRLSHLYKDHHSSYECCLIQYLNRKTALWALKLFSRSKSIRELKKARLLIRISETYFGTLLCDQSMASNDHGQRPRNSPNYLLLFGFFSPSESSSLFNSFISLLKMRNERPNERAESGRRLDPKRTTTTIRRTKMCHGRSKFILWSYPASAWKIVIFSKDLRWLWLYRLPPREHFQGWLI